MPEATIRDTLDRLIRMSGQGYAELSRLLGRNPAYVQQYIRRGVPRRLSESDRRTLAAHFNIPETALGGLPPVAQQLQPEPARHGPIEIPFLANTGPHRRLTIDAGLIDTVPARAPSAIAAHVIEGDAMAPTLLGGDHVLVDVRDRSPPRDGLYVIEGNPAPLVKRLSVHPVTRRLAILSDNAAYPSFPDCEPIDIRILGRVIWVGRKLG